MFNKTLILASLLLASQGLWSSTDEALILNQELEFLQESATQVKIIGESENSAPDIANTKSIDDSLERKYFGDEIKDSINTKASAPVKKRSF